MLEVLRGRLADAAAVDSFETKVPAAHGSELGGEFALLFDWAAVQRPGPAAASPAQPAETSLQRPGLPGALGEALAKRLSAAPPPQPPRPAEVPHYRDEQGAMRPLMTYLPRPRDALDWLATTVEAQLPGGLLEAEAFAFMYNVPANLWRHRRHDAVCSFVEALREGDHTEHFLSSPLNLVEAGDGRWSTCSVGGELLSEGWTGHDALYQAMRHAAYASMRPGLPSTVPDSMQQIRADIAARFRGASPQPVALLRERDAAVGFLRLQRLDRPVYVTRHDPAAGQDYLAPDFRPPELPQLGLVHRGATGWRLFVASTEALGGISSVDRALVPVAPDGALGSALVALLSLSGRDTSTAIAQAHAAAALPPVAPNTADISEHFAERVTAALRRDNERLAEQNEFACPTRCAEFATLMERSAAFGQAHPLRPFASPEEETVVKNYMRYLGEARHFGAEVSVKGLGEVLDRRVRVWTPADGAIELAGQVYGPRQGQPTDLYRVGAHYQYLDTVGLARFGIAPADERGRLSAVQLGTDATLLDQKLLESGLATDVGGDGDCQFLVMAYADNTHAFRELHQAHSRGEPISARVAQSFPLERGLAAASEPEAFDYLRDCTAQALRTRLIERWLLRLEHADYATAGSVHALITELLEAAHNEVGEVIGKARSANPSYSWLTGLKKQSPSTLRQRIDIIATCMGFCPESDDRLRAQGEALLATLRGELAGRGVEPTSADGPSTPLSWVQRFAKAATG